MTHKEKDSAKKFVKIIVDRISLYDDILDIIMKTLAYLALKEQERQEIPFHQTFEGCRKFYEQHGFKALIVWCKDLENEESLVENLTLFLGDNE